MTLSFPFQHCGGKITFFFINFTSSQRFASIWSTNTRKKLYQLLELRQRATAIHQWINPLLTQISGGNGNSPSHPQLTSHPFWPQHNMFDCWLIRVIIIFNSIRYSKERHRYGYRHTNVIYLEKGMAILSSILAGYSRIPWTEEPEGLQSMNWKSWTWPNN